MKKPIFRRKLNNAFVDHKVLSNQILKAAHPNPVNVTRIADHLETINARRANPIRFPRKSLEALAYLKINTNNEKELLLLKQKRDKASRCIKKEKQSRKGLAKGSIRLIHAGTKVRRRLGQIQKRN